MGLLQTLSGRLLRYDSAQKRGQQACFDAARNLANAQFRLADAELTQRLWQDVADRDLDVDRILNLMYGCWFQDDPKAMADADDRYVSQREADSSMGIFSPC